MSLFTNYSNLPYKPIEFLTTKKMLKKGENFENFGTNR